MLQPELSQPEELVVAVKLKDQSATELPDLPLEQKDLFAYLRL